MQNTRRKYIQGASINSKSFTTCTNIPHTLKLRERRNSDAAINLKTFDFIK